MNRVGIQIFGLFLILGVGAFTFGHFDGKEAADRYYATHRADFLPKCSDNPDCVKWMEYPLSKTLALTSEHSIKGMAFEGDCRIVPPVTQDFQDNTFTYAKGPCFIGARGMKITRHSKAPERITSESGISCTVPAMSMKDATNYFNTDYCDNRGVARPLKEL